jgi:hypothetical protein
MTYMLLYVPVCLVSLLVYEACRHDDLPTIARKTVKDFGVLSAVFVGIAAVVYLINRLL